MAKTAEQKAAEAAKAKADRIAKAKAAGKKTSAEQMAEGEKKLTEKKRPAPVDIDAMMKPAYPGVIDGYGLLTWLNTCVPAL